MTTFDGQAIAARIGLDRPGRAWTIEKRASGFFVTATDKGHRADAILHANQLIDPECAQAALADAIRTVGYMLDIDLAAEPA